jgi:hypothetical protein
MKYRAKIVGAALQIDSNPTVGTRVTATMDLRSSDRVPGPAGIANRDTRAAVGLGLSH